VRTPGVRFAIINFMNKTIAYIITGIVALVGVFYVITTNTDKEKQVVTPQDYKNIEYVIDGKRVKLTNGVSETEVAPGSASKIITRYFGNEVWKDLNSDGNKDIVFLLTQETGGSGVFFYVVAALADIEKGYVGSQGLLLGDRIAPQTTESGKGKMIIVNYAVRAPGEPFTTPPSIGKSIWLLLDPKTMQFGEVAQNFEGEADPARMTLTMTKWIWISALYNDGKNITPKNANAFTLTFSNDGVFSATTDCNSIGGIYTTKDGKITFNEMRSTLMYCEGSQESEFVKLLNNASSYHFTSRGELILDLKFDSGSVIFR